MLLNSEFLQAKRLEESEKFDEADKVYARVLEQQMSNEEKGRIFHEYTLFLLRRNNYIAALRMLVDSYKCGYKQNEVLKLIDEVFYFPNQQVLQKRFENNLDLLLLEKNIPINNVSFKELPLKFIPCADTKYYVFSVKEKKFLGVFDQEKKQDIDNRMRFFYNVYSQNTVQDILLEHNDESIFLVYLNWEEFFSFLQVYSSEILQNKRVKVILTLSDFIHNWELFGTNGSYDSKLYQGYIKEYLDLKNKLQQENIVGDSKKIYSFGQNRKSEDKIKKVPWKKGNPDILLSICIPTYNRGAMALANIEHILQFESEEIEVIVSDNCSPDIDGKYAILANHKDPRLKYFRNNENIGFAKNWLNVIEKASGKFVFTLSDEDFVNIDELPSLLQRLRNERELAAIRVGMKPWNLKSTNAAPIYDALFLRGYDALINCGFCFNYISGSIYNRDLIVEYRLFEPLRDELEVHAVYPHLYLELLLCTVGNYLLLSNFLVLEGEADVTNTSVSDPNSLAYSYAARLAQHDLFSEDIVAVANCFSELNVYEKANLYLKVCQKTATLIILVNGPYYQKQGKDLDLLINNAYYHCMALVGVIFDDICIKRELENKILEIFKRNKKYSIC